MQVEDNQIQLSERQRALHIRIISRTILSIYLAVSVPLRFAFIPEYEIDFDVYGIYIVLDLLSSLFFLIDSIFIFQYHRKARVAPSANDEIFGPNERSVSERQRTLRQSQIRLIVGIVSSLPLEYMTFLISTGTNSTIYFTINKIIVVSYLPGHIEDLSILIELNGIIRSIGLQRAWKLFFVMALAGHWCCCGFYFVAKVEAMFGDDLTWAEDLDLFKHVHDGGGGIEMTTSVAEAYIQSLYWAYITMVSNSS